MLTSSWLRPKAADLCATQFPERRGHQFELRRVPGRNRLRRRSLHGGRPSQSDRDISSRPRSRMKCTATSLENAACSWARWPHQQAQYDVLRRNGHSPSEASTRRRKSSRRASSVLLTKTNGLDVLELCGNRAARCTQMEAHFPQREPAGIRKNFTNRKTGQETREGSGLQRQGLPEVPSKKLGEIHVLGDVADRWQPWGPAAT